MYNSFKLPAFVARLRELITASVLFQYSGFAVSYESGIHSVPQFDAHIEVYGQDKIVRIQYDTPYVNGSLKETVIRQTYEDAYTQEPKHVYE